jgi:hypothetical protein
MCFYQGEFGGDAKEGHAASLWQGHTCGRVWRKIILKASGVREPVAFGDRSADAAEVPVGSLTGLALSCGNYDGANSLSQSRFGRGG